MKKTAFLLLLTLGSCTWKSHSPPPEVALPENYTEDRFPQPPGEEVDLAKWWKQFDDPLLDGLIQSACEGNFDIQIAMEKVLEVRELYKVELSRFWPQIDYNMFVQRTRRSDSLFAEAFLGPIYQTLYSLDVSFNWEIDLFGKNYQRSQAALGQFQATREELHYTQLSVIAEIAKTYLEVRYYQELIRTTQDEIRTLSQLTSLVDSRYGGGLINEGDLNDAKELLENTKATLPPLESILRGAILRIGILTGKTPESLLSVLSLHGKMPTAHGKIPVGLPSDLLRRRPDIQRAERELEAAGARLQVAKAELFPQFSLYGNYGYQSVFSNKWLSAPSRTWDIAPGVQIPLFTGGRLSSNIRAETHRQEQASLSYEKTVVTALEEVERNLTDYFEESKRGASLGAALERASDTRNLAISRFEAGVQSLDGVLELERRVLEAKKNLLESREAMLLNLIGVYKALGGGWECSYTP